MRMYSTTIFKAPRWWEEQNRYVYDNKTHRRMDFGTWPEFVEFLRQLSERKLNGKQDAELLSPSVFKPDTTRKNDNVIAWAGWAAVDVDDLQVEGDLQQYLHERFGTWNFVCYSTASSTDAQPKFRLVFELDSSVAHDRIKHLWFALNNELSELGDPQTKDLARMYYIPAHYAGANNFFFVNNGSPIDVDMLLAKHPFSDRRASGNFLDRLPDAFRDQVIAYRRDKLDDTSFVWSSYKDCPFWPKRMAAEYVTISAEGWYRKMYQIMIGLAGNAVSRGYPLTAQQIVEMCRQFDSETGNWYESRPMDVEANNALEYVYINGEIK